MPGSARLIDACSLWKGFTVQPKRIAAIAAFALVAGTVSGLPAASGDPSSTPPTASVRDVTLPTGDEVQLTTTTDGSQSVLVLGAHPHDAFLERRMDGDTYVIPSVAQPFLGRGLDLGLFDVSRLVRSGVDAAIPVRFSGATPPGVTETGAGVGTLTDAAAFGAALRQEIGRAVASRWQSAPSIPGGTASVQLADADSTPGTSVQPAYDMWTLKIKVLDGAGKPAPAALVNVLNADDSSRYTATPPIFDGTTQVSVPAGDYSALADIFTFDAAGDVTELREVSIAQATVRKNTTLTLDGRKALPVTTTTPHPTVTNGIDLSWQRVSAAGVGTDSAALMGPGISVYEAPTDHATIGELHFGIVFDLSSPAASASPYTYSLAYPADGAVPASQHYRATAATLATLHARYFTDVAGRPATSGRVAMLGNGIIGFQFAQTFATPMTRTEYVTADPAVAWQDNVAPNTRATPTIDPPRTYGSGTTRNVDWFHGPLVPGFASDSGASPSFLCPACRNGDAFNLSVSPTVDSTPGHTEVSFLFGNIHTVADAHVVLTQGATVLADNRGWNEAVTVPADPASYQLTVDETRQATWVRQSTASHTEWTFASTHPAGTSIPPGWTCRNTTLGCAVLPLINANYQLQVGTDGTAPAGPGGLDVAIGHLPGAPATPISTAAVQVSFDDGVTWTPTTFANLGGGHYRARWTNPASADGGDVAIQVTASDAAGATFSQIVHHAYTIDAAGSAQ